jgi:translocation and assembly module TamB
MRFKCLLALLLLLAAPAAAQEGDGKTFLEGVIEDALSGEARTVTVTGFDGALSSNATLERMTIADADGVWLTLEDASLVWSRAALLRGRLEVEELTADSIDIARLPEGGPRVSPADAEATPFALPDLPVSVSIGTLRADRVRLGPTIMGEEAELRVESRLQLADGAAKAELDIRRLGRDDRITLDAAFSNASRELRIDLDFDEAQGGLVSRLLAMPGRPALRLQVTGDAPLSDFEARVALSSDGVRRFGGPVRIAEAGPDGGSRVSARLEGDLRPLVAPEFHPFFGAEAVLTLAGQRAADGRVTVEDLTLGTEAMDLTGSLALAPDGWPERVALDGRIGGAGRLRLPVAAPVTHIRRATLSARYDAASSDEWQASATLEGLQSGALAVRRAGLDGTGTLARGAGGGLTADIGVTADGVTHDDAALDRALGPAPRGQVALAWRPGAPVEVAQADISSGDVTLSGRGEIGALADGFPVAGRATLRGGDLRRFAPLAGRDLAGAATASLQGTGTLLGGAFDIEMSATTTDLRTGTARLDPLLKGRSTLDLAARRDETGTRLDRLVLRNDAVTAHAEGRLSARAGRLTLDADIADLSLAEPRLTGPGRIDTAVSWTRDGPLKVSRLHAEAAGAVLDASGTVALADPDLPVEGRLRLSAGDLSRLADLAGRPLAGQLELEADGAGAIRGRELDATLSLTGSKLKTGLAQLDRVLAGEVALDTDLAYGDGTPFIERLNLVTPRLTAEASSAAPGEPVALGARLSDLALLAPGLDGPARLDGTVRFPRGDARTAELDARFTGPGAISARVAGRAREAGRAFALDITGQAPLALANGVIAPRSVTGPARFDLRLDGPPRLSSLSGSVDISGARVALPALKTALTDVAGSVRLADGTARADITGSAGRGGRVRLQGPVGLSPPFRAALEARLTRLGLRDPELFETTVSGRVEVTGPLAGGARIGGALSLGRTELRVPSGMPGGADMLGGIRHVGEPAAVRRTRQRAGLVETERQGRGGAAAFPLDLTIDAPNRIFVRGRRASGVFNLVRGRIDVLTKRLELTEGLIDLRGALDPYLRFVARTQTDDLTIDVVLEGQASAPEVTFTSSPELPQEEILAQLLFGRSFDQMSAFQAAQLVGAAATLSGNGSGGLTGRLRDSFGLSDLDVTSTAGGATEFTAGAYISDNIYSELSVDSEGNNRIDLNLDLSRSVTVKGRTGSSGDTGIGIFFEKDY